MDIEGTAPTTTTLQYLTFRIEDEEYAVNILRVEEILQYETTTKVPSTPDFIHGVINIRGRVVPLIDLGVKFGLGERKITKLTCAVIVEIEISGQKVVMGVLVDSVNEVIELRSEDIDEPPRFGMRAHIDYLLGMGKVGADKHFVLLLDIDHVLSTDDLAAAAAVPDMARPNQDTEPAGDAGDEGGDDATKERPTAAFPRKKTTRRKKTSTA